MPSMRRHPKAQGKTKRMRSEAKPITETEMKVKRMNRRNKAKSRSGY